LVEISREDGFVKSRRRRGRAASFAKLIEHDRRGLCKAPSHSRQDPKRDRILPGEPIEAVDGNERNAHRQMRCKYQRTERVSHGDQGWLGRRHRGGTEIAAIPAGQPERR